MAVAGNLGYPRLGAKRELNCGLKTRQGAEVVLALRNMTDAAQIVRQRQGGEKTSHT